MKQICTDQHARTTMQALLTNASHLSIDNRLWSKPPNRMITFLETKKKSQKDNWRSVYATPIVFSMFWRQDPKQSFRTKDYSLSNQYKGRRHLKKQKQKTKTKTKQKQNKTKQKKNQKWPPSWTLSDTIWRSAIHPFSLSPTQNVLTLHHCQKTIRNWQFQWPFCFLCCSNGI